jgi:hypothetical protein
MRTFYDLVGEAMHQPPGEWMERLTPWIITVLGGGMVGLVVYSWWTGGR